MPRSHLRPQKVSLLLPKETEQDDDAPSSSSQPEEDVSGSSSGTSAAGTSKAIAHGLYMPATEIIPKLWIGGQANVADRKAMHRLRIRRLLCLMERYIEEGPKGFDFMFQPMRDEGTTSLVEVVERCLLFLDGGVRHGHGTMVYCRSGVNRSPTVVIAYLMRTKGMSLHEAMELVKKKRAQVSPCEGYMRQLIKLEYTWSRVNTLQLSDIEKPCTLSQRIANWREQRNKDASVAGTASASEAADGGKNTSLPHLLSRRTSMNGTSMQDHSGSSDGT